MAIVALLVIVNPKLVNGILVADVPAKLSFALLIRPSPVFEATNDEPVTKLTVVLGDVLVFPTVNVQPPTVKFTSLDMVVVPVPKKVKL